MYQLSIIILSNTEEESLRNILEQFTADLRVNYQITVLLKTAECPSAMVVKETMRLHPDWNLSYKIQQSTKRIDLLQEAVSLASGTHVLVWTSDDEVKASGVISLSELSAKKPNAIVSLSKFNINTVLEGYGFVKTVGRKILNYAVRILYRREGDDFYSTYQIVPCHYFKELRYSQNRNFAFEYTLIPLRVGVEYIELPMVFQKRTEGKSNFGMLYNVTFGLEYLYNIIKLRFTPKSKLVRWTKEPAPIENHSNKE